MTTASSPIRLPGMHDVARLAGVSHQTVSRVLNGHPNVRPETKARVLQAIADLGYRRNTAARALVTQKSGTIGVITVGTALFGPTSTWLSVESAAREAGYFVSVASLAVPDAAHMTPALEHFMNQAVEGVVVIAPQVTVVKAAEMVAASVPVVLVADVPAHSAFHSVAVDQKAGARMALRHLMELGHRDIAHLAGPQDFFDGRSRLRGWRQEMKARGLPVREPLVGDWSAESGFELGRRAVAGPLPEAFFVGNDLMALGLIQALFDAGVRVPEDVSVVGFDDVEGTPFFRPPLTTVRQDFATLGRRCIETMLRLLEGRPAPASAPIAPELIIRGSTAAARTL